MTEQPIQKRVPTEKQFRILRVFGSGRMLVSGMRRELRPLVRWGWLAPERPDEPDNGLRVTPDGYRALAAADRAEQVKE